jgi:hypothetical protein
MTLVLDAHLGGCCEGVCKVADRHRDADPRAPRRVSCGVLGSSTASRVRPLRNAAPCMRFHDEFNRALNNARTLCLPDSERT